MILPFKQVGGGMGRMLISLTFGNSRDTKTSVNLIHARTKKTRLTLLVNRYEKRQMLKVKYTPTKGTLCQHIRSSLEKP